MTLYLYELYADIRDNICNRLIKFLINHCHPYASTFYAIGQRFPIEEMQLYIDELTKER